MSDMGKAAVILRDLVQYVANEPGLGDVDWSGLGMVARSTPDGRRIDQMYGSVFMRDGSPRALELSLFDVAPFFERLLALQEERGPWIHALVQIERPSGNTRVQFEYEDPHKWEFDASDTVRLAETLRPRFVDGSS